MKFKSALIVNFKLLREVSLDFSLDPARPVTVIRAENGSGKTSTLSALQWGLYGDAGLDLGIVYLQPPHTPAVLDDLAAALAPLA